MVHIVGIAGSLRQKSFNAALLRAAAALAPEGCEVEIASIAGIPLYDGDVEAESGIPESVVALKARVSAADGLLLVSPEYNHSLPGVFKNAIDWMSRGGDMGKVFGGRPVGIMGASPGPWGTANAQIAWMPVFRALGLVPFHGASLQLSRAGQAFTDGELVDEDNRVRVQRYMASFAEFVAKIGG